MSLDNLAPLDYNLLRLLFITTKILLIHFLAFIAIRASQGKVEILTVA